MAASLLIIDRNSGFTMGDWFVDPASNVIENGEKRHRLQPRVMDVLVFLAEHAGKVTSRSELLEAIWPGLMVTEDALNRAISDLRKVLGDPFDHPRIIETIRKRGYRLLQPVAWSEGDARMSADVAGGGDPPIRVKESSIMAAHIQWKTVGITAALVTVFWFGIFGLFGNVEQEVDMVKTVNIEVIRSGPGTN